MKHAIALAASLVLVSTALADKKPYTLADLKTLVSQKSYKEAVAHLTDVGPSERNADWLGVAVDAAAGYIGGLSNDDLAAKILEIERIDSEVPQILTSTKYTKVRTEIGLKGFESCFGHSYAHSECFQHAIKFVDADAKNAELALKMAKLVRRNTTPHGGAASFWKRALDAAGKNAASVCKDEDMKLVVVSGFNIPYRYEDSATVRAMVTGACWDTFKKVVVEELKENSEESYERINTCEILRTKKAMTSELEKLCAKAKPEK
jgi:hypothetical protein